MVRTERKKVWSCNKFKKMKCQCNRWVLVRNPDTPKEIVQFVHEVRPVFAVTLSTLLHMLCGRNDNTMPSSNIFRVHFAVIFNFTVISSLNKSVNDWKTANDVRTCWKLMTSLWMMHTERKIGWSSKKFKKHWSALVTDEFSSETLILRKRLSSLYTRCVQISPWPSLLFCSCYAGEMMIPCEVPTFSEFIL